MLAYLLALVVLVVAGLLVFAAATFLHLHGTALIVLAALIAFAAVVAAIAIVVIHLRAKKRQAADGEGSSAGGSSEVDVLLIDANRKLRSSKLPGAKSLDGLPLLYLLGEAASAKTSLVMRSGLDPELIAGSAPREGDVSPTPVLTCGSPGRRPSSKPARRCVRMPECCAD